MGPLENLTGKIAAFVEAAGGVRWPLPLAQPASWTPSQPDPDQQDAQVGAARERDAEVVFLEVESKNSQQPLHGNPDPQNGIIAASEGGVNLYDHVDYDSHVERAFAIQLENKREQVKLFTKLPRRFCVGTPVGEYSPDWAIVYDENGTQRLYLIRETKDTRNLDDLDWDEAMRIRFAERHFDAAPIGPVDYNYTTDKHGLLIGEGGAD